MPMIGQTLARASAMAGMIAVTLMHAAAAQPAPAKRPPATQPAPPAAAAPSAMRQSAPLLIDVDGATMIQLPEPARTVFIANPDIADIHVATPTSVLVYGRHAGATTVFAIGESGTTGSYPVRVSRSAADLKAALQQEVPNANLRVTVAPEGITISGTVPTPREAERLRSVARQFVGEKQTLNVAVTVQGSTQVSLRVRVAEVSRNIDRRFGVNWGNLFNNGSIAVGLLTGRTTMTNFGSFVPADPTNAYGSVGVAYRGNSGQVNASALIDALDQEGLATILAEPNLTASSGESANFLAGGEFPIPVPQGSQTVTVEYKRFGVSVEFTPVVLDGGRLSIRVRPEVSQLTTVGDLKLNNVEIPALTVRRAETTVEMASGQSFAIAGLFQNNASNMLQALPGLGDLPILGPLFRSTSFQRNESELVIIVTPYLVRPVSSPSDLQMPTDGLHYPSDIERILGGRGGAGVPRLRSAAGLMLE